MDVWKLQQPFGPRKVEARKDLPHLWGAEDFKSKNIACVVHKQTKFLKVLFGLENLGFEVACSLCLDATFKAVYDEPEEWAMVIIRLDQPIDEERLERYVRLIRLMDFRIPVLVMVGKGKSPEDMVHPKLYADCVVREPESIEELSLSLKMAVGANTRWGSRFSDFRLKSVDGNSGRRRT